MRILAGILLLLASLMQAASGAILLLFGVMGTGALALLTASLSGAVGQSATPALAPLASLSAYGPVLIGVGAILLVVALIVFIAVIHLLIRRPSYVVFIGCVLAAVVDSASLALLGFMPVQLVGVLGALLGLFALASMSSARQPSSGIGNKAPVGVVLIGLLLLGAGLFGTQLRAQLFGAMPSSMSTGSTAVHQAAPIISQRTASSGPTSTPFPTGGSGAVRGGFANLPFTSRRVEVKTEVWTTVGDAEEKKIEKLVLRFVAGENHQITIERLPKDYDIHKGLSLNIPASATDASNPWINAQSPKAGSSFGHTEIWQQGYDLTLRLDPLDGNRVAGQIGISIPKSGVAVSGNFQAWVEGRVDVEPDLTQGGRSSFRYLMYTELKAQHPGAAVTLTDDTYRYQTGDAVNKYLTGAVRAAYDVNGTTGSALWRIDTEGGRWRIVDQLRPDQIPGAHPLKTPERKKVRPWVKYVAAQHAEQWLQQNHADAQFWSELLRVRTLQRPGVADVKAEFRFLGKKEKIKHRFLLRRTNDTWSHDRDLDEAVRVDAKTGAVSP